MSPERWQQIQDLFHQARICVPGKRAALLEEACKGDKELRRELEWMLAHQDEARVFIQAPALELAAMSLATDPGVSLAESSLGLYEDLRLIGKGGMGEVYRARDPKLMRDVAIKVLPRTFAGDSDRLARFQREAQVLASLNHPNISIIHDIQEDKGLLFLVLEYVEGETLGDRLKRGPIPLDETLSLLRQVTEALEAAHEKGIFHRDLKPANIQVTPDGQVKVLDFGLAKHIEPDGRVDVFESSGSMIFGTAAYMSPEQASGSTVDKRTDVWALGCVLYEALTARRAFGGENAADTIAAIMKSEPDYNLLPAATPPAVRSLLHRCLQKQIKHRLHDISDVRIVIEDALAELAAPERTISERKPAGLWVIASLVASLVVGVTIGWIARPAPPAPAMVTHLQIGIEPAAMLGRQPRPSRSAFALSPDGRLIVFVGTLPAGQSQLYARELGRSEANPIPGTEDGVAPFFSPDGQWVGFFAQGRMKKVPIAGGPPVIVCSVPRMFSSASWADDGSIFFDDGSIFLGRTNGNGISKVSAGGGTPTRVATSDDAKGERYLLPQTLPGGKAVMFTVLTNWDWEKAQIVVYSLQSGDRHVLIEGGTDGRYLETGHLLYMRAGTLMAVPFDVNTLSVVGDPVALIQNVMQAVNSVHPNDETGLGHWTTSKVGTLIYATGGIHQGVSTLPVWVNRDGHEEPVPSLTVRPYYMARLSPGGDRLATTMNVRDIWLVDILRGTLNRLTSDASPDMGYRNTFPIWSPDGKRVVYGKIEAGVSNLYIVNADGSGKPERLTTSSYEQYASSWTPQGDLIAFVELHPPNYQIWVLPMGGDRTPKLFLSAPSSFRYPEFSPDGHWIAYTSNETGTEELYVQPYPGPGEKHHISTAGGSEPIWVTNGELMFRNGDKFYSVVITSMSPFSSEPPRLLFERQGYAPFGPIRGWSVTRAGRRFLLMRPKEPALKPVTELQVVLNWTEDLKRRVLPKR